MKYYKRIGSDTYHWHRACSSVPADVETNPNWRVSTSRPSGEKCNECMAKDREYGEVETTVPEHAWLTGRETDRDSPALGEVVVADINLFANAGPAPHCGPLIDKLPHGTPVRVVDSNQDFSGGTFYKVSTPQITGWVFEPFVAREWSCFTFLGTLEPASDCVGLDVNLSYGGMDLLVLNEGAAVITEGEAQNFKAIWHAVSKYVKRVLAAHTPLSVVALRWNPSYWVGVSLSETDGQRTVGFMPERLEDELKATSENFQTAQSIVPLMASVPYLDLALSDLTQALTYQQHALIFLARGIESIENYFQRFAKEQKGKGKEQIMREMLGVEKAEVDYVVRRANEAHRRHASPNGIQRALPQEELVKAFETTAKIIAEFVGFLRNRSIGSTLV